MSHTMHGLILYFYVYVQKITHLNPHIVKKRHLFLNQTD